MDYLDFSKEMARMDVKRGVNQVRLWRSVFYLNLIGVIINISAVIYGSHIVNAICAGSLIANLLWIMANLNSSKVDLKFDLERLNHLEKYTEEKNIDGLERQLQESKKYYQDYARYQDVTAKMNFVSNASYPENKPSQSSSPTAGK